MRVMLVGTGAIAYRHAAACRDLDGADLVAVCDVRREAADALADQFEVESRYTELGTMLTSEQADLAIIADLGRLPRRHRRAAGALGARCAAILCEKPLAMDAPQAEAMFEDGRRQRRAAGRGVPSAPPADPPPGHRADPLRADRRGASRAQRHDVRTPGARGPRPVPATGASTRPSAAASRTTSAATASISCAGRWTPSRRRSRRSAAGGRPAWTSTWSPSRPSRVGGPPSGACPGRPGRATWPRCSAARARSGSRTPGATTRAPPTTLEIFDRERNRTVEEFAPTDQFWLQLQHMQDCLDNGTPHRIPPENSIAQMRVIDAVYASLQSGKPETV